MNNITEQEKEIVNKLNLVKEEFIKNKQELKLSVRKDVIITELKDLLVNNSDFYSLKNGIEELISQLEIWNKEDADERKSSV